MHNLFWLAYIDPGFGSIVFQALAAGLLGVVFAVRAVRMKIAGMFAAVFRRGQNRNDHSP